MSELEILKSPRSDKADTDLEKLETSIEPNEKAALLNEAKSETLADLLPGDKGFDAETPIKKSINNKDASNIANTSTSASTETDKDAKKTDKKQLHDEEYSKHVSYNESGCAIYTDPKTNHKYQWSEETNSWTACATASSSDNPYENEHYRWCSETQKWLPKAESATALSSATETEHYKWNAEKNEWIPKSTAAQTDAAQKCELDEEGRRTYTDKDGVVFFWDDDKSAWFPKIDDDFMARYQMSYGFIDNTSAAEEERKQKELAEEQRREEQFKQMAEEAKNATEATKSANAAGFKRKAAQEPPKWFDLDPQHNTKVYVSNLPLDITLEEFTEVMSKCGMIMRDPQTQKYKLKLYAEADGQLKGDGLCDYIKIESVDLALSILDEYEIRGHKIRVQPAKFQMRGEYNPALKPKRKKKDREKLQKLKEKLFDWRPEKMRGERSKNERSVIIKNLFSPELFEKEVQLILDYQNDLREECSKCGTVRKVIIYDLHAEGVAQVNMCTPEEADLVIQMMNGRYFGQRKLSAEHWDGKTKYKIAETDNEAQQRLTNWDRFLQNEESNRNESQANNAEQSAEDVLAERPETRNEADKSLDTAENSAEP